MKNPFSAATAFAVFLGLAAPTPLFAHADVEFRISAMSKKIAASPTAENYVLRGNLHQEHGDWQSALADYQRARELQPGLANIDYQLGQLHLRMGNPQRAEEFLRRFLAERPESPHARFQLGRALARQGKNTEGAHEMDKALSNLTAPTPQHYIERTKAISIGGQGNLDAAIASLDAGIARLGPVVALAQIAIEWETGRGRYTAALSRIEALPEAIKNNPSWLIRRGDLHAAAGELEKARSAYQSAANSFDRLPARRRATPAIKDLRARIDAFLATSTPSP